MQSIDDIIVNDVPGIKQALDGLLFDLLINQAPIFELPDPLVGPQPTSKNWGPNPISLGPPITGSVGPPIINLPIPIPFLGVAVDSAEMVLEGDIGP